MATFNEFRAPTSRAYVVEQGIVIPNWLKIFQTFRWDSSVFALEAQFWEFLLPLIDCLVATLYETHAPTSRKYIAEQGIAISNRSKTFPTFWSHSSVFPLEKQPKNLNFQNFFTSYRPFGGFLQCSACTDFQKICISVRYSDAKLIKNIPSFLVALLRFCFRKTT